MRFLLLLLLCAGCATKTQSTAGVLSAPTPPSVPSPLSAVLVSSKPSQSYSATISWHPSTKALRYRLYYGTKSRQYSAVTDSFTTNAIAQFKYQTLYYFAVTAVSARGLESPFSAEGRYSLSNHNSAPAKPINNQL